MLLSFFPLLLILSLLSGAQADNVLNRRVPQTVNSYEDWTYQGCYRDRLFNRALPVRVLLLQSLFTV